MNIIFSRCGKSMGENASSKAGTGSDTYLNILNILVEEYPQHTFYLMSPYKGYLTTYKNVVNLHNIGKDLNKKDISQGVIDYVINNNLKFDFGIVVNAMLSPSSRYCISPTLNRPKKPFNFCDNYVQPIQELLNYTNIPYVRICEDVRALGCQLTDNYNQEILTLSQFNRDINYTLHFRNDKEMTEDETHVTTHHRYYGPEKVFLYGKEKIDYTNPNGFYVNGIHYNKDKKFIIALNGSADRYKAMKKWVFPIYNDIIVYGANWDSFAEQEYKDKFENKKISEMESDFWRSKYTYVPFFKKRYTDFVTQKVWTMLYYGIIPFWCKSEYDTSNIYSNFPDYIKVETPEEMAEKIHELDNNPDKYFSLLRDLYNLLDDKYFTKDYVLDMFSEWIPRNAD